MQPSISVVRSFASLGRIETLSRWALSYREFTLLMLPLACRESAIRDSRDGRDPGEKINAR
jgi:hypothetical protein